MIRAPDSLDELAENPEKFGMPTFDQFVRNHEKYRGRYDEEISAVDRGDPLLRCKQTYYIQSNSGRYRVTSLEQAERIAVDMGLNLHKDFILDPQVKDDSSVKGYHTEVTFRPKALIEKRKHW